MLSNESRWGAGEYFVFADILEVEGDTVENFVTKGVYREFAGCKRRR